MSNKVNKYMQQYQERNYAPKARKIQKSDLAKYCDRSESGKAAETGNSDSVQQSWKEQEDQMIRELSYSSRCDFDEIKPGEEYDQSKTGLGSPIQSSGEVSSQVGCGESSSGSSSCGEEEIRRREDGEDGVSREKEEGKRMKKDDKKKVIKHIKADDKEFRKQIAEDVKLKKELTAKPKKK